MSVPVKMKDKDGKIREHWMTRDCELSETEDGGIHKFQETENGFGS